MDCLRHTSYIPLFSGNATTLPVEFRGKCYLKSNKDLEKIGATWVHEATSIKLFMHENGAVQLTGWDKIYESDKKSIETSTSDRKKYDIKFTDYQFNIKGNNAWVLLNATWNVPQEDSILRFEQKRVLAFEKSDGKWKYTLMAICKSSNK